MNTNSKRGFRGFGFYAILVLIVILIWYGLTGNTSTSTYTRAEFEKALQKGNVTYVKVEQNREVPTGSLKIKLKDGTQQYLYSSDINEMQTLMDQNKFENYVVQNVPAESWIMTLLPYLLIFGAFFILFMIMNNNAAANSGGSKMMNFGKSRAKLSTEEDNKMSFDNVAGLREEKEDLEELVDFLRDPKKYTNLGARIPKGVLLVGPPGTGKTLLAKAVAGEAGVPFFSISGSDFVEMFVGVGASRVRDLFENARKYPASIVFIDEIDAVGRHRGAGLGGGHDEREQTLNQLLVEMDGFGSHDGIIVMAATNRPDVLDPALLRPGRFDRQITVNYPDTKGRRAILDVHARNKKFESGVDFDRVAKTTPGFTGADLANLLNEAALLAARRNKSLIGMKEIEESFTKIIAGPKKKSMVLSDKEKKNTAYHEAGHAIVSHVLPTGDPVHLISIIPSGRALGYTLNLPDTDKVSEYRQELLEEISVLLAGRAAERIVYGDYTGGASNDIERATAIAKKMVTKYGMSDTLGPIKYGSGHDENVFLGRDFSANRDYSESVSAKIDEEIHKIVTEGMEVAVRILNENREKLDFIADFLFNHSEMDKEQFELVMSGSPTVEEVENVAKQKEAQSEQDNKTEAEAQDQKKKAMEEAARERLRNLGGEPEGESAQESESTNDGSDDTVV